MSKTTVDELKTLYVKLGGNIADVANLQTDAELIDKIEDLDLTAGRLPEVTTDDNGDILSVVEGAWAKDNKLNRFFNEALKRVALNAYTFSHTLNGVTFTIRPQRCGTVVIFKVSIKGTATGNGTYEFEDDLILDLRPAYSINPEYYDSNGKKAAVEITNGIEPIYIECSNGGTWDVEDTLFEIPFDISSIPWR